MPEEDEQWRFARARGHLLRWWGDPRPRSRPATLEVHTQLGWVRAGRGVAASLWRRRGQTLAEDSAATSMRKACVATPPGAERMTGAAARWAGSSLRWMLSPPLGLGAPRFLTTTQTAPAQSAYLETLDGRIDEVVVEEALAGYQRGRERHNGIESRTQSFVAAAGLTTALVLANGALLRGENRIDGVAAAIALPAVALAALLMLSAALYGLLGTMYTFDRVAPNTPTRVASRARAADVATARRRYVASIFASQRRTGLVAEWKLARLKRATVCLLAGISLVAAASITVVLDALAS